MEVSNLETHNTLFYFTSLSIFLLIVARKHSIRKGVG